MAMSPPVFDSLLYDGKPDLTLLGFTRFHVVDRNPDNTNPITQTGLDAALATILLNDPNPYICFDVELPQYPSDIRLSGGTAAVDVTIAYFTQVLRWARAAAPTAKLGFYGIGPIFDYWAANNYNTALQRPKDIWWAANTARFVTAYGGWQAANTYLAPLLSKVDFICPQFYTFYDFYETGAVGANPDVYHGWKDSSLSRMNEGRQYGKPIYRRRRQRQAEG
jgi:hypothetical protein